MKRLPEKGSPLEEVMDRLRSMQVHDADYHSARTWSLIYNAGPDVDAMLQAAGGHVLLENALNPFVFPSLKEMQRDVVAIVNDLLHGDDDTGGAMTSGGTEAIFMGGKAAGDKMGAGGASRAAPCRGGLMPPFLEPLGYEPPPWDFRVSGVTSISADLHKYGYA